MVRRRMRSILMIPILLAAAQVAVMRLAVAGPYEESEAAAQRGDYRAAFDMLVPEAEHGDARAQYTLGVMYARGKGVRRDDNKAALWFRRSADQGLAAGQLALALSYLDGRGVQKNRAEAVRLLKLAAAQGLLLADAKLKELETRAAPKNGTRGQPHLSEQREASNASVQAVPRASTLRLPSLAKCQSFQVTYSNFFVGDANGAVSLSVQNADEANIFRTYFDVDLESSSENDLKSVLTWISSCHKSISEGNQNHLDYLDMAMHTVEMKLSAIALKNTTSNWMQGISGIPACDSRAARSLLESTISDSPQAQTAGIKFLAAKDFEDITEETVKPAISLALSSGLSSSIILARIRHGNLQRFCKADVLLNSGERELPFLLKWFDTRHEQLVLQIPH